MVFGHPVGWNVKEMPEDAEPETWRDNYSTAEANKTFIEATNAHLPLSAANISYLDLPGLQGQPIPPWAVSANVEVVDPEQAPISASLIVQSGNTTVGITGITKRDESFVPSPAFRIEEPVESAVRELELMRENVDLLLGQ